MLVMICVGMAVHQTSIYFRYFGWESAEGLKVNEYSGWPRWDFSAEDRLFVLGDVEKETRADRWRATVAAFPDDPAVYWRYAEIGNLPEDYRETVDRIAPHNGYFDLIEAADMALSSYDRRKIRRVTREDQGNSRRSWSVIDQVDEDSARKVVSLVESAIEKPEFFDYLWATRRELLKRTPKHYDWVTQRTRSIETWGGIENFQPVFLILHHEASKAVEKGDRRRFVYFFELGQALAGKIFESSESFEATLMGARLIFNEAIFYQEGALTLGMPGMLAGLKERERLLEGQFQSGRSQQPRHPLDDLANRQVIMLSGWGRYLEGEYGLEDYQPMARTLDAFVAWQKSLKLFWLGLLIVLSLMIFGRFRSNESRVRSREIAGEVSCLRVVILGSGIPLLLIAVIYFSKVNWEKVPDPG